MGMLHVYMTIIFYIFFSSTISIALYVVYLMDLSCAVYPNPVLLDGIMRMASPARTEKISVTKENKHPALSFILLTAPSVRRG